MSTITKQAKTEQAEALAELRKIVRPGDTLQTILRHVSRSGMSREISVTKNGRDLDSLVARALDMKIGPNYGLKIGGCGMDMGFALVYNLSSALYGYGNPRGYACQGDRCPSNSHVNDRNAPRGKGVRHHDGYAVSQRWL